MTKKEIMEIFKKNHIKIDKKFSTDKVLEVEGNINIMWKLAEDAKEFHSSTIFYYLKFEDVVILWNI